MYFRQSIIAAAIFQNARGKRNARNYGQYKQDTVGKHPPYNNLYYNIIIIQARTSFRLGCGLCRHTNQSNNTWTYTLKTKLGPLDP